MGQRRNIIDQARSCPERGLDHRRLSRIDRHCGAARGKLLHHRQDALDLVALPHVLGARARRFTADINDCRARCCHGRASFGGGGGIGIGAAIGE